ncbi:hypothetical protein ACNVED_07375 [Legionella sp. D16C41]|uniref:hypothetical protein n=1 Tax=Legionella sp. D16C41 TaxID=3402688 RepID=UPI003AF4520A
MSAFFNSLLRKRYNKKIVNKLHEQHNSYIYNFHIDRILTFSRYAYNYCDVLKADLYISHGVRALAATHAISLATDTNYIYDAIEIPSLSHRNIPDKSHPVILNTLDNLSDFYIRNSKKIMTVSNALGKYLTNYNVPIHVLPNYRLNESFAVQKDCHSNCLHKLCGIKNTKRLILVLSTITSGIESLFLSIPYLPNDIDIVFLGNVRPDSYKLSMQKLAKKLKVSKRCHWLNPVPYTALLKTISCAVIGLILLNTERLNSYLSLPNRVFDYFAANIPIISPNIPDITALLQKHTCGITLDNLKEEGWAKSINYLLQNLDLYKDNISFFNKTYTWQSQEEKLLKLIDGARSVTILSMNDLVENQRFKRIANTLAKNNILVKVFCLSKHKVVNNSSNIHFYLLEKF